MRAQTAVVPDLSSPLATYKKGKVKFKVFVKFKVTVTVKNRANWKHMTTSWRSGNISTKP